MENDVDAGPGSTTGNARPEGLAFSMRTEAEHILKNSAFQRSPTIVKLLRFLIAETLAGRSHLLKSYTVAVDGLDRSTDFDSSDSYARVQMGRLRKMLQGHYAEHGPVDDLCLYLQPGSYTVRTGQLATAYPTLYRPLSANATPASPISTKTGEIPSPLPAWYAPFWRYAGLVAGLLLIATIAIGLTYWYRSPEINTRLSPVLELMPVDAGTGKNAKTISSVVGGSLNDGLTRFKISRVRVLSNESTSRPTDSKEAVYRMYTQILTRDDAPTTVYLRLNDSRANTLIWSREIKVPEETAITDAVASVIAEINGPHGVIATHSATLYKDNRGSGYPCLIKYFTFLKTRDARTEKQVASCFEKPVEEQRLLATILASRAFFELEKASAAGDRKSAMTRSRRFAEQAIAADSNDGAARFAMARLAYVDRDCMSARFYTQQTYEANPYSPVFMPALAAHAPQCGYERSGALLDQAFLVARSGDTDSRLLLVLAAVVQNRSDRIDELEDAGAPRDGVHRRNYYLTEAIIAASKNRTGQASRFWEQFSGTLPAKLKSPDAKLESTIMSPLLRRQVVQFMVRKNVFGRGSAS